MGQDPLIHPVPPNILEFYNLIGSTTQFTFQIDNVGPGYKCPFPVGNISWKTWKMLLVGPAIDGKVYESDLINDGWNRTLWLSTISSSPIILASQEFYMCQKSNIDVVWKWCKFYPSLWLSFFLIKKKCTHLRSAITKANFEYLFQHRHFFHRLTLMMILYLYWKGSGKIFQIRIFLKRSQLYISSDDR